MQAVETFQSPRGLNPEPACAFSEARPTGVSEHVQRMVRFILIALLSVSSMPGHAVEPSETPAAAATSPKSTGASTNALMAWIYLGEMSRRCPLPPRILKAYGTLTIGLMPAIPDFSNEQMAHAKAQGASHARKDLEEDRAGACARAQKFVEGMTDKLLKGSPPD